MPLQTYSSTVSATQDQLDDLVLALLPQQGQRSQETYLHLAGATYVAHGVFRRGSQATSVLLDGFAVQVDAVFDAA